MRVVSQLLMAMSPAAYFSDRALLSLVLLKMANLSLVHGVTMHSAYGFLGYGMVLTGALGAYRKGFELGELALELDRRFPDSGLEARICHMSGAHLMPWVRPFSEAVARLRRAQEAAARLGDPAYGAYAASVTVQLFELQARSIAEVLEATRAVREIAKPLRDLDRIEVAEIRLRTYLCLRDAQPDPNSLSDAQTSEDELRARLTDAHTPMAMAVFSYSKALLSYHFGHDAEAWRHIEAVQERLGSLFSMPSLAMVVFYRTLIAARLLAGRAGAGAAVYRRAIRSGVRRLASWAELCPENFAAMHLIAAAEAARAKRGKDVAAAESAALEAARRAGAIGLEALALEHSAERLRQQGETARAAEQLQRAVERYRAWGALAKADRLEASAIPTRP
jgi:hypothetical protein